MKKEIANAVTEFSSKVPLWVKLSNSAKVIEERVLKFVLDAFVYQEYRGFDIDACFNEFCEESF